MLLSREPAAGDQRTRGIIVNTESTRSFYVHHEARGADPLGYGVRVEGPVSKLAAQIIKPVPESRQGLLGLVRAVPHDGAVLNARQRAGAELRAGKQHRGPSR